jgi:hypothetical protein
MDAGPAHMAIARHFSAAIHFYRIDPSRRSSFHGDSILEKSPGRCVSRHKRGTKASRSGRKKKRTRGGVIKKKEKGARWVLASGGAFINVRYGSGNCQKLTGGRNVTVKKGACARKLE